MNVRRVFALARRVIRQLLRDRRTVALLIVAPILILTLGAILFRAKPAPLPLGVVNEDQGIALPVAGSVNLGQRIADALAGNSAFTLIPLRRDEVDNRLRDGSVDAVVIFRADFSSGFQRNRQAVVDLRLEGSNPTRSVTITARVAEASMKALAGLLSSSLGVAGAGQPGEEATLPVTVQASYLFAGKDFDTLDYVAPVYIALLALFFVFILTCVSFLRERSQGTMERLMATPANRLEVVMGYMIGLGFFALLQSAVILFFTVGVLKIHYLGSLGLLFVIIALLAVVGVSLGILASAFARNEFQVVQFIPLLIIPQALLGGTFFAVQDLPGYLQPFAYAMPITYANWALRDVMLKGRGLAEIWPYLLILVGFAALLIALAALTTRREVA